jgi:hypothetical protein
LCHACVCLHSTLQEHPDAASVQPSRLLCPMYYHSVSVKDCGKGFNGWVYGHGFFVLNGDGRWKKISSHDWVVEALVRSAIHAKPLRAVQPMLLKAFENPTVEMRAFTTRTSSSRRLSHRHAVCRIGAPSSKQSMTTVHCVRCTAHFIG